MARTTRSKAAATAPDAVTTEATTADVTTSAVTTNGTATKPETEEPKDDSRSRSQQRRGLRRKLYKKAKRHQNTEELHKTMESAGTPMSKKERSALRAQAYQPHRVRAKATTKKVSDLEKLVRKQQEEIRELRKLAVGGSIPKLQPPASPPAEGPEVDAEPDSSPAKIRDQLFADAARSSVGDGTTVLEVEEVVTRPAGDEAGGEPMEGVEETTVVTSVEQDVEYPTLPAVEETTQVAEQNSGDKQEDQPEAIEEAASAAAPDSTPKLAADTPIKSKEEVRDSSAEDSNAGTPRNVRRSPRKKAKGRSFAGHSYVG
ncbi:hypothetical protein INS49_000279 [Diaporthe citri]|uniref:uncharacterized protein n=1 Tax=Diaporthe citri TaxID=83186 RepID=UPI001C82251B|nr:uncharacterized protein INS49_000279 [Diaporthe citri]KAG6366103.1 hypothetical protein INS49_000279 [Diaporthe citri]